MSLVYHEVFDDILTEVFLKLPAKSLFRFKCLSKKWNRVLSSYSFRSQYVSIRTDTPSKLIKPLGFFRERMPCRGSPHLQYFLYYHPSHNFEICFLVGDSVVDLKRMIGLFIAESNGIILYGNCRYFLCDPITKRTVMLPQPRNGGYEGVGFYYEEVGDKETGRVSANFKVVCPAGKERESLQVLDYKQTPAPNAVPSCDF